MRTMFRLCGMCQRSFARHELKNGICQQCRKALPMKDPFADGPMFRTCTHKQLDWLETSNLTALFNVTIWSTRCTNCSTIVTRRNGDEKPATWEVATWDMPS